MGKINWRQVSILSERYLDLIAADRGNLVLLLAQAPIIAICIMVVWGDVGDATDTLYYVLALAAVWFGTINSCRELVKERAIFERERRVGLETKAYLVSKVLVLTLLGLIQCFILLLMVSQKIEIPGNMFIHYVVLSSASVAGTGLGLLISSLVGTVDRAVAAVPILLMPQILFSEMVYPHDNSTDLVLYLENSTILSWSYQATKELTLLEPSLWPVLRSVTAISFMAALFCLLALWLTSRRGSR